MKSNFRDSPVWFAPMLGLLVSLAALSGRALAISQDIIEQAKKKAGGARQDDAGGRVSDLQPGGERKISLSQHSPRAHQLISIASWTVETCM
jgi:hypothetical protein